MSAYIYKSHLNLPTTKPKPQNPTTVDRDKLSPSALRRHNLEALQRRSTIKAISNDINTLIWKCDN